MNLRKCDIIGMSIHIQVKLYTLSRVCPVLTCQCNLYRSNRILETKYNLRHCVQENLHWFVSFLYAFFTSSDLLFPDWSVYIFASCLNYMNLVTTNVHCFHISFSTRKDKLVDHVNLDRMSRIVLDPWISFLVCLIIVI